MNIYSAEQLSQADQVTVQKQGITSADLMERAASMIFQWLHQRLNGAQVPIHIFCGIGNNGGDGLVLGRQLIEAGYTVHVYIANFTDSRSKDFLLNYNRIKEVTNQWPLLMTSEADFPKVQRDDIIVDCLFGLGLNRPPEGWLKKLIQYINSQPAFRLSVDMPSGLAADLPLMDPEAIVRSNHTLTFQAPKLSFFLPETGRFVPYFEVLDIGLDREFLMQLQPLAQLVYQPMAQQLYRQRDKFAHKGTYGHAVIAGGSLGKVGAIHLSCKAALKAGAGLVTAYVPKHANTIIQSSVPEVMCMLDESENNLTSFEIEIEPSAMAVGMGMGTNEATIEGLEAFLDRIHCPMVFDADALNCFSMKPEMLSKLPKYAILTPHEGELKRLIGQWEDDFDKLNKTKAFTKKYECVVIIKGAHSLIIHDEMVFVNTTGNPGMATAGSGDVLSGILAGLSAQGYAPMDAAILGVYLHGTAGNLVAHEDGYESLIASDIIQHLGKAFLSLFESPAQQETDEQ